MDRFLEALDSLDTAKTSPFAYSFGDVVFFERMRTDRCNLGSQFIETRRRAGGHKVSKIGCDQVWNS
jgi:hypothetical protein